MPSMAELEVCDSLIRGAVDKWAEFSSDSGIERIAVDLRSCTQVIEEARHIAGDASTRCILSQVKWEAIQDILKPATGIYPAQLMFHYRISYFLMRQLCVLLNDIIRLSRMSAARPRAIQSVLHTTVSSV